MIKKYLQVLIVIVTLFCTVVSAETESVASDIAYKVITDFGIIDSDASYEEEVNREDFVKASVLLTGATGFSKTEESLFSDVTGEYAPYINYAHSLGYISGVDDGVFGMNEKITVLQAAKIIEYILGYNDTIMESRGGYPTAVIQTAFNLGLNKNIGNFYDVLTYKDMANLIYNALEVETIEQTYNNGSLIKTNKTILNNFLKYKKIKCKVLAVNGINLTAGKDIEEGHVVVQEDGRTQFELNIGTSDIRDYIGQYVTMYFFDNDNTDEYEVICCYPDSSQKIVIVDSTDISGIEGDYFVYSDNNREKKADISAAIISYNGKITQNANLLDKVYCGRVKLIYEDNAVAFAVIESYYNAKVSYVDNNNEIIYLEEIKTVNSSDILKKIDVDTFDYMNMFFNGEKTNLSEIQKGYVVSVALSEDKKYVRLDFCDKSVDGTITKMRNYSGRKYVVIDGDDEYVIATDSKLSLAVGDSKCYLINAFGEIFTATNKSINADEYAYFLKAGYDDNGFGDDVVIKVLCSDGKMNNFELKDTVKYDGSSVEKAVVMANMNSYQLIKFKKDSTDKVYYIETTDGADYTSTTLNFPGYDLNSFSKDNYSNSMCFKNAVKPGFDGVYLLEDDAIVFNIPEDKTAYDDYTVTDYSTFLNNYYYIVKLYEADERRFVPLVVSEGIDRNKHSDTGLPWTNPIFIVNEFVDVYDEAANEVKTMLEGYVNCEKVRVEPAKTNNTFTDLQNEIIEDPEDATSLKLSQLQRGDIIQYNTDTKGMLDTFRSLYSVNDVYELYIDQYEGSGYSSELTAILAKVTYSDDKSVSISIDDNASCQSNSNRTFPLSESVDVYIYDSERKTITVSNMNEIAESSIVFMRVSKGFLYEVVIFR